MSWFARQSAPVNGDKVNFHIDEAALQRAVQPGVDRLEAEMNQTLQNTIREVRDTMTGQPADQVYDQLVSRLQARLVGIQLNEPQLGGVAQAIQDGTLTD
jgi:hypothetical protein